MYFCTTANSRIMASSLQTDRFTNLLNGIEALAGEEWQQFLAQFKKIEQRRRAEEQWPPEERAWVEQARRARLSEEEMVRLKLYAHKLREEILTTSEKEDYRQLLARSEQNDLQRAEALVALSRRWKTPVKQVIKKIGLPKIEYVYVGK